MEYGIQRVPDFTPKNCARDLKIEEMKMEALNKTTMDTHSTQISVISMKIQG